MQQKGKRNEDMPNRSSNMEQAEGSREQMTNRSPSEADRGTSTDRAMFDDEAEPRPTSGQSSERGSGVSGERNRGSSGGGISNRGAERERSEQNALPARGRSQSER